MNSGASTDTETEEVIIDDEEQQFANIRFCTVCGTKKTIRYSNGKKNARGRGGGGAGARNTERKKIMAFCIPCSQNKKKRNE